MVPRGYASGTDVGCKRNHNEDNFLVDADLGLWIVADGMGGHEAGEVASAIAVESIHEFVKRGTSLETAVKAAHQAVVAAGNDEKGPGVSGMGSTCVAVKIEGHSYEVTWVGDSRAYFWDGKALRQITRDHSYVQSLIDTGAINAEQALVHPDRSILTQCLGSLGTDEVQVDVLHGQLLAGERLVLCSDGLTGELSDAAIAQVLSDCKDDQLAVDRLILSALIKGGSDNVTVQIISAAQDAPSRSVAA